MLDWKMHLIFGLLTFILLLSFFYIFDISLSPKEIAVVLLATSFSSLFPDADMPKSKIRGVVSFVVASAVCAIYIYSYAETWYYAPMYFAILYFIFRYLPTKHRGIAHTFRFSLLFSAIVTMILYIALASSAKESILYFASSLIGYNLHLVLDRI
jgi:membrane-bound metal-dependent hydrolase YbcI (DUF457 family)